MNRKNMILGAMSLALLGAVAITAGTYAYQGDPNKQGSNYTPERHETMLKAFENKDYATWKAQMGDRGATSKVTEQNFARFAEMRQLMLDGKTAEAQAIRKDLGLGQGNGQGKGMHSGERRQNRSGNFVDANGDGKCDNLK